MTVNIERGSHWGADDTAELLTVAPQLAIVCSWMGVPKRCGSVRFKGHYCWKKKCIRVVSLWTRSLSKQHRGEHWRQAVMPCWGNSLKAQRCFYIVIEYGELTISDLKTESGNDQEEGGLLRLPMLNHSVWASFFYDVRPTDWSWLEQAGLHITPSLSIYDPHLRLSGSINRLLSGPSNLADDKPQSAHPHYLLEEKPHHHSVYSHLISLY